MCAVAPGAPVWRNPITGIAGCCAPTGSGHATAAAPTSVMNSRSSKLFKYLPTPPSPGSDNIGRHRQRQLPEPPEDQSQERNRHPLTYDYKRQGTIIVIHAHSLSWSWRSRHLTPFVAGRSKDVREVGIRAVPDYEEFIGAKKHLVLGLSSHAGSPPKGSCSFSIG